MHHKYIRHSKIGFIIWPKTDDVWHNAMGKFICNQCFNNEILSAGFVSFKDGKPRCYGGSESLHIYSLPDDSEKIAEQFGL